MHFVSLFFLYKRNITTSLWMIHLKCTVVHFANINSSSIEKSFLNYILPSFCFFQLFCIYLFVNQTFGKSLVKNIIFNTNFQNSFQYVVYYRLLRCQTLWYYNGDPSNITQVSKKRGFFIWARNFFLTYLLK